MNILNLYGFLALLSIPVILYIHMLQRKSKTRQVSTLFLLNKEKIEKKAGSRLDKLRNSKLLWLNLLAAILLTILLLQVRKIQEQRVLKIVVLVDSSASMQAFWTGGAKKLSSELSKLASEVKFIDLKIMSTSLDEGTIYSGARVEDAYAALGKYFPSRSGHDFGPAIRRARSLIDEKGILILCSDQDFEAQDDVKKFLIGNRISNVGFTGFQANGDGKWQAIVKNHSSKPVDLNWLIGISDSEPLVSQQLKLQAGELRQIRGEFPPGSKKMVLSLPEDLFLPDNKLYAVKPKIKKINIKLEGFSDENELQIVAILNRFQRVSFKELEFDFQISSISSPAQLTSAPGIYFLKGPYIPVSQEVRAFNAPIIEGLNWQGIPFKYVSNIKFPKSFYPLLKYGNENLLMVRDTNMGPQFLCNFDLDNREIISSPALIILMYRAVSKCREYLLAYSQQNFESGNDFTDKALSGKDIKILGLEELSSGHFRTLDKSGFFELSLKDKEKDELILSGGVFYADAGEGDFSQSISQNDLKVEDVETVSIWEEKSYLQSFCLLLLIMTVIHGWYIFDRRQRITGRIN